MVDTVSEMSTKVDNTMSYREIKVDTVSEMSTKVDFIYVLDCILC